jgi:hypothetical protein
VPVADVQRTIDFLYADAPEVYHNGCREFAIRDPDGYLIIFTEETDDPPACPAA